MNLIDVLQNKGVNYKQAGEHHHCREGWVNVDCPYCSPNWHKWRMGLHLSVPAANCWNCGKHSYFTVLRELTNLSYLELKDLVKDYSYTLKEKPSGRLVLPSGREPLTKPFRTYLESRRINPEEAERLWGVEGIRHHQKLSWRLFLPAYFNQEILSWTTRHIGSSIKRYMNSPPEEEKYPLKKLLYGEDLALGSLIVVEGPLDAIRIGPGAVALCGVLFSNSQINRIIRYPKRGICFDNEPKAQERAKKLCETIKLFPGETYLIKLKAKDPGEASYSEIKELRRFLV